jgi:hypothetical protein
MATDSADDLVPFHNVRVIRSTPPALLCRIGRKNVWLPREHISGRLWCIGNRGKLFIRRWVARDRNLIDFHGKAVKRPVSLSRQRLASGLRLVGDDRRDADHAN